MLCPCCGVPVVAANGGRVMGSALPPRRRRRGGHRRSGGYEMSGAERETDRELVALLESKQRQLARFGLVDAGDPLLEAIKRKVD